MLNPPGAQCGFQTPSPASQGLPPIPPTPATGAREEAFSQQQLPVQKRPSVLMVCDSTQEPREEVVKLRRVRTVPYGTCHLRWAGEFGSITPYVCTFHVPK